MSKPPDQIAFQDWAVWYEPEVREAVELIVQHSLRVLRVLLAMGPMERRVILTCLDALSDPAISCSHCSPLIIALREGHES